MAETFISTWGYLAVFAGVLLEGEVAYLSGILFSEVGRLQIELVFIVSLLGSVIRDLSIFLFARKGGQHLLDSRNTLQERLNRLGDWMERRPDGILVLYRFFYGTSTLVINSLALSRIRFTKYFMLVCAGSFLWATVYGFLGYFAAIEVISHLEWIQEHMDMIGLCLFILIAIYLVVLKWKSKKSI